MTTLLIVILGLSTAYGIYIATLSGHCAGADHHLDAGGVLPGWTLVFAGVGIVVGSLGLHDHLLLTALYGLPYSHVALGLVIVALTATLFQKRLWLAARLTRHRSPVELFGAYYGSVGLRVLLIGLVLLFAVPFAAGSLSTLGGLLEGATGGVATRGVAIWITGFFLFLSTAIGGWRGLVYGVAAQSFLLIVLLVFLGGFAVMTTGASGGLPQPIAVAADTLADKIPGVLQYTRGLGKEVALGGPWTTGAIFSFSIALIGIVLSPGFSLLTMTTSSRTGFAFSQVWMVAALGGGLLLLTAPIFAGLMGGPDHPSLAALTARLAAGDGLAAILFTVALAASLQITIAFFAGSSAHILTLDLVARYALPTLTAVGRRLAARITLAVIYAALCLLASAAPLPATLLGTVALSLSAQLLPPFLGLCWVPWMSRSAVLSGLVIGILLVVFTEPPGLILFEGLFLDVPWGRWPLTINSALWGLVFNVAACLLVSIFTRGGEERAHREILHRAFAASFPADFGSPAARTAKWSLALVWAFMAIGPGAILGNDFFSHPIFTEGDAALGVPALWVWQVVFWLLGVLLVWWLAYPTRMAILDVPVTHTVDLIPPAGPLERPRVPAWIALLLERLTLREAGSVRGIGKRHIR